jgi:hypothetical protein
MRSPVRAAILVLVALSVAASGCEPQASGPLFSLRGNLRGAEPAGAITVAGFGKSRSGTVTLVAWLTRQGQVCYGGVAADVPGGLYECRGPLDGMNRPGPPLAFGKPIFWAGPGSYIAFGFTRGATAVRVTMFGKVIRARVRRLAGGAAGVYAFPIPPHGGHGFSSDDITSVVGLGAGGSVVARAGRAASILAFSEANRAP